MSLHDGPLERTTSCLMGRDSFRLPTPHRITTDLEIEKLLTAIVDDTDKCLAIVCVSEVEPTIRVHFVDYWESCFRVDVEVAVPDRGYPSSLTLAVECK